MCTQMGTKTISIMDDVYKLLLRNKMRSESFSDVIRRNLKKKRDIMEFAGAWKNINEEGAEEFFNSIYVFPFDNGCGEKSAKILARLKKEGKLIEQNDCFIAAIVLNKGIDGIITRNKEHFSKIKGLKIIGY